ncbi:MAG: type III-A CRISPR-associated RAMP protein Csm5 [Tissierellia bacterium]|nr:type III-A CRISPR-associated RAMP protein Csm5 [Tissierellia bacterium]
MKIYNVKLTTIGPVHIGCGETRNKMQYVNDFDDRKVYIPDDTKFMKWIIEKGVLDNFENYFMQIDKKKRNNLYLWLKANNLLKEYKNYMAYYLDTRSFEKPKGSFNEIQMMIKTKDLKPYIPGSSLKGAIRTALFNDEMGEKELNINDLEFINKYLEDKDFAIKRGFKNKIGSFERESNEYFNKFFERDITKDVSHSVMKDILISDSKPISNENLILAQKIDFIKTKSGKPVKNALSTFRESIAPSVELKFEMVIKDNSEYNIEDIKDAIYHNYTDIDEAFLAEFDTEVREGELIYIGGGTGFASKTSIYSMFEKEDAVELTSKILDDKASKHNHLNDIELKISPREIKKTKVRREYLEMGLCKIEFEEKKI